MKFGDRAKIVFVNWAELEGTIVDGPWEERGFVWFLPDEHVGGELSALFLPADRIHKLSSRKDSK